MEYILNKMFLLIWQNLKESSEADRSQRIVLPVDWKKAGTARIKYTHASCPGLTSSLTCTSLGPYVMVHGMSEWIPSFFCNLVSFDSNKNCSFLQDLKTVIFIGKHYSDGVMK